MSALPVSPQPVPDAPQLLSGPAQRPRSKGPIYFFVMLILAGTVWYFRPHQEKPAKVVAVRTIKAAPGAIESTRRIAGSITASRFANIVVPILQAPDTGRGLTLMRLAPSGKLVKEGDLLAEIDAQDMRDHLD